MPTLRILSVVFDEAEEVQNAIVELIDEDIKLLAVRRKAFLAAKEADPDLVEHTYRAHDATFYRHLRFKDESLIEGLMACELIDEANILFLADKDEIFLEKSDPENTNSDCVCIDEEGVWWQSFGTGDLRTEMVFWDKLFEGRL